MIYAGFLINVYQNILYSVLSLTWVTPSWKKWGCLSLLKQILIKWHENILNMFHSFKLAWPFMHRQYTADNGTSWSCTCRCSISELNRVTVKLTLNELHWTYRHYVLFLWHCFLLFISNIFIHSPSCIKLITHSWF